MRAYRAGDFEAHARARAVLGDRAAERFALSDAQYVVARESGYSAWRELLAAQPRAVVTDLSYAPGDPVVLRVTRHRHLHVDDGGGAVARAGTPLGWRAAAERLAGDLDVNVSRGGVVSLPVVAEGPGYAAIVRRIAAASVALYEELLELDAF